MFRLSRSTSFVLSSILILGFFVLTFTMNSLNNSSEIEKQGDSDEATRRVDGLEAHPSGSVVLTNFHRSQTKNGRKEWEVTADVGEYLSSSSMVRITNGVLTLYRDDGSTVVLTAPSADIELSGADLKTTSCSGGVIINYDDQMKITTATANYWKETGRIHAPTEVTIVTNSGTTSGDSLVGNSMTRVFELIGNVHSMIESAKKEPLP